MRPIPFRTQATCPHFGTSLSLSSATAAPSSETPAGPGCPDGDQETLMPSAGALAGSTAVRAAYDAIARAYDAQLGDELERKPLDRALLSAIAELAGEGTLADVGCGPGHVTRFLAARHTGVIGRWRSPWMLQLPAADGAWAGAIALYSIIHPDSWPESSRLR